jgi:hypothetical protein
VQVSHRFGEEERRRGEGNTYDLQSFVFHNCVVEFCGVSWHAEQLVGFTLRMKTGKKTSYMFDRGVVLSIQASFACAGFSSFWSKEVKRTRGHSSNL